MSSARSVQRHSIPTRLFRLVHREVGKRQHLHGFVVVEQGDPNASRDMDRLLAEHCDLPAQGLDDAIGHDLCLVRVRLRKQHGELISANPRQDIRLAHAMPQCSGDVLEEIIAHPVAEGIVHVLEVVQIDHEQRALGAIAR